MSVDPGRARADEGRVLRADGEAPAPHPRDNRATVRKLRSYGKEFGLGYAALALFRRMAGWLPDRIDDRLLAIEGRRGVLGPAHRRWSQHSVQDNREVWSTWEWSRRGEEWTASPGWKASLIENVMVPTMPEGGRILEIGPGGGRWTAALHELADYLILVDITDTTLEICREHLGNPHNVTYLRSDGNDLRGVESDSIDGLWSFDAFVHIAPLDIASYLRDIRRVLRPGGVALIHHSGGRRGRESWRSPMTGPLFANLAREGGLVVERQFDSWDGTRYTVRRQGDLLTELRRPISAAPRSGSGSPGCADMFEPPSPRTRDKRSAGGARS